MARDIGPEMLEVLDVALADGSISRARYDAKRAEVLELIRQGKAVELSAFDKTLRAGLFIGGVILGLVVWQGGTMLTFLLGIAIVVAGTVAARHVGRTRI